MSEKRLSITQWAEDDRPREKLIAKGKNSLSDAELLGILIGSGTAKESAVDLAKRILAAGQNDLNRLAKMGIKELTQIKGIGQARAITIMAAIELGRRRKETESQALEQLRSSQKIFEFMKPDLLDLPHEQFWVILMNNALRPIKKVKIGEGGITQVSVDLRIIFKEALENYATSIVLVHNHPSEKKEPSQEDIHLTKRIFDAGQILNIRLLDHVIFTNSGYYSFQDEGQM
jgi:DNA repair protein RadC